MAKQNCGFMTSAELLIRNLVIPETLNNPRDFELSTKGLSSGVYIMILENGCTTKQLKFAIENDLLRSSQ